MNNQIDIEQLTELELLALCNLTGSRLSIRHDSVGVELLEKASRLLNDMVEEQKINYLQILVNKLAQVKRIQEVWGDE